jgi:hypothetical protein
MATPLTPTLRKFFTHLPQLQRFVYDIPSVLPATTSPRYELLLHSDEGRLEQIRLNYPGTPPGTFPDIAAFIFTSDLGARGTLEHLIETPVIDDGCFSQVDLKILFENTDPVPAGKCGVEKLYIEVDNTGAVASGIIELELIIRVDGSG